MNRKKRDHSFGEGGLLALEVGSIGPRLWLGAAWAVLCGAAASGGLEVSRHALVVVLLTLVLADPVLGSVWTLVGAAGGWRFPRGRKGNPGGESAIPIGTRLRAGNGIGGWVVQNIEPASVDDVQNDPRFDAQVDGLAGDDTHSLLAVPLAYRETIIGVIEAANKAGGRGFDSHDRQLLNTLAGSTAIAIENARLYQAEREVRMLVEQSQMQVVQTEKLAATGRLAASLAHEINNPLQAIHNSLQLMLSFQLEADEQQEYLQIADEEIERLMNLVASVLDFARPPQREMRATNLNDVVNRVLALAGKYLQHRRVAVKRTLSSGLPSIVVSPDELEQVFINLVLNAVDAMPEGGTLHVASWQARDGRLAVAFSDTGHGIAPEDLKRVFEPFFSTREDGTGLGLTVSHSVIERHGGEIVVESTLGQGTTFTVWLPGGRK